MDISIVSITAYAYEHYEICTVRIKLERCLSFPGAVTMIYSCHLYKWTRYDHLMASR